MGRPWGVKLDAAHCTQAGLAGYGRGSGITIDVHETPMMTTAEGQRTKDKGQRTITVGHSPDPDDAFMFFALAGVDLVVGEGVEHEGVVGVGAVADGDQSRCRRGRHGLRVQRGIMPTSLP